GRADRGKRSATNTSARTNLHPNPKQLTHRKTANNTRKGTPAMQPTLKSDRSISDPKAVVAVYNNHSEAEAGVKELQTGGFDTKKLSIVGKDYHTEEQVVGYYNTGDRLKYWGRMCALWGGLWGLLLGAAFFWVPGVGPLLVAGPVSAAIVAALESAVVVGGMSVFGASLYSLGIPKHSVLRYVTAINVKKDLLVA